MSLTRIDLTLHFPSECNISSAYISINRVHPNEVIEIVRSVLIEKPDATLMVHIPIASAFNNSWYLGVLAFEHPSERLLCLRIEKINSLVKTSHLVIPRTCENGLTRG